MNDMIIKAAQDPSCILAVTPDRGGSWWATLRPGGNYPWPSATLRNFADEPSTWGDAKTWFDHAPAEKMIFDFEFEQMSIPTKNRTQLFGNNGRGPFSCEWIIASDDRFIFRIYFYDLYDTSTIGDPYLQIIFNSSTVTGKHAVHAEAADGIFSVTMDETDVSDTRIGNRVNNSFAGVHRTTADCTIQRLSIFVENYTKFSYPSEAERVRLLTKTNVRTDRGVFEAADETKTARIDTALDLRGKVSSYTVVVDFEAAEFPETTTMECHQELAGQGGALIGSSYPPICSIGYYYLASSGSARLQLSQEVAGGRHVVNATLTGRLSGRHICCGVVEVDPASPLTASTLYLDGVRIGNASIYAVPTGNAAVNATCFSIAGHSFTGGWPPYTGKVYSGLLFDRALSAAEIAALCPTSN